MKKIGKEVLFLRTSKNNPRNGESTMIRLKDNRIMFAYTEYYDDSWADHATARISAVYSDDEGETWSNPSIIINKPPEAQNIMSPSLVRLPNDNLGIIYLRKDVQDDMGVTCMPVFSSSQDEGKSWSEPVICGMPLGYYCAINDGAIVTKEGRIYVPMSYLGERYDAFGKMTDNNSLHAGWIRVALSDDNGQTWIASDSIIKPPYPDNIGLGEPGIYQHANGKLWMYMRTAYGHQYQSFSQDNGENWTEPQPNLRFTTPDAPMRVKKVDKYVIAVYNPVAYNCLRSESEVWNSPKRTPIVVTVSGNDGHDLNDMTVTFANGGFANIVNNTYYLEDDTSNSYCYPSICEVKDGFLVSYYHSDGSNVCLNASKIVKVYFSELE